jgi:hypothetical protein
LDNQEQKDESPDKDINVRKYNKRFFPPRPDGGPVMRSKAAANETTLNQINPHFDYNNVETCNDMKVTASLIQVVKYTLHLKPLKTTTSDLSTFNNNVKYIVQNKLLILKK